MDVQQKLDEIVATVQGAKSMPMSASCVINRGDLLARLEEVRQALPGSLAQAQEVLGDREQVVAEAQAEARRIVEAAHAERAALVEATAVVQQAQAEASRILAEARNEAAQVRAEADDYVDSKLANFEVVLGKTIGSVDRGREKLLGPERGDPQELLQRADAYVEAQFGAIEAVLRKTLEAVGRGRQKLGGHRPIDDLAEHIAAQEAQEAQEVRGGRQGPVGEGAHAGAYYGEGAEPDTYEYLGVPQPQGSPEYDPQQQEYQPQQAYAQAAPDPYAQPGYAAQGYGTTAYPPDASHDPYGGQQPGTVPPQAAPQQPPYGYAPSPDTYQGTGRLDETSLFDTGLIDAEQLRRYQQGHS